MYRHGDVFLDRIQKSPRRATKLPHCILAEGELTGHTHYIAESKDAELFELGEERYLHVVGKQVSLLHPEHDEIKLPRGIYRVWFQREYSPKETRRVID